MYAIIESGGKQYRVEKDLELDVAKLDAEPGSELTIEKVLMVGGDSLNVGKPYVDNAKVTAQVVEHGRGKKIVVFHKLRRKDSRKTQGHRQDYTRIKITGISA